MRDVTISITYNIRWYLLRWTYNKIINISNSSKSAHWREEVWLIVILLIYYCYGFWFNSTPRPKQSRSQESEKSTFPSPWLCEMWNLYSSQVMLPILEQENNKNKLWQRGRNQAKKWQMDKSKYKINKSQMASYNFNLCPPRVNTEGSFYEKVKSSMARSPPKENESGQLSTTCSNATKVTQ